MWKSLCGGPGHAVLDVRAAGTGAHAVLQIQISIHVCSESTIVGEPIQLGLPESGASAGRTTNFEKPTSMYRCSVSRSARRADRHQGRRIDARPPLAMRAAWARGNGARAHSVMLMPKCSGSIWSTDFGRGGVDRRFARGGFRGCTQTRQPAIRESPGPAQRAFRVTAQPDFEWTLPRAWLNGEPS